jgi:hypothetical protein
VCCDISNWPLPWVFLSRRFEFGVFWQLDDLFGFVAVSGTALLNLDRCVKLCDDAVNRLDDSLVTEMLADDAYAASSISTGSNPGSPRRPHDLPSPPSVAGSKMRSPRSRRSGGASVHSNSRRSNRSGSSREEQSQSTPRSRLSTPEPEIKRGHVLDISDTLGADSWRIRAPRSPRRHHTSVSSNRRLRTPSPVNHVGVVPS